MLAHIYNADFAAIKGTVDIPVAQGPAGMRDGHDGDCDCGLSATMIIGDGTWISMAYWRLIGGGRTLVNSIEHGQARGLPPIDALAELARATSGRTCTRVTVDPVTGDLVIALTGDIVVHAFRFRSLFEDWEVRLPDGEAYWSNMVTLGE